MINNMSYHKKAWKEFVRKHELSLTDEEFQKNIFGKKNDQIFATVFGDTLSPYAINKYTEEKESLYRELYAPDIQPVAGLQEVLTILKNNGKKLAVATTAPKGNRDFGFKAFKLENTFSVILGDEHVTKGKPDPEIYLETAKLLEVDPARCIVFEDSHPGVQSGKNAGMTVIGLLTTHSAEEIQIADYRIKDFTDITFV